MSYGWVSIHRQLQNHWVWNDKPFSYGQAWIDIILLANHSENKFPLGKEIITIDEGSFITSELKLMDRWGWSKAKVRRFLTLLENDSMIVRKTDTKKTTITVVNYGTFQESETTKRPKKDRKKTDSRPKKDTNNNDNNVNNNNNDNKDIYGEFSNVKLSDEELQKLKDKFPDWKERIETLSSYIASSGKKYSSHYATILSWARKDAKKPTRKEKGFNSFQQNDYDFDALEKELCANAIDDDPKLVAEREALKKELQEKYGKVETVC